MAAYTLPDLPYDYGALEPHLSGRIVELHHDKHHRAYVAGANRALEALEEARAKRDTSRVGALERALAFNLSGHVMHSIYWRNLSADGGGEPEGELGRAIGEHFGSFAAFKSELVETSATIFGSGWGVLAWEPVAGRLVTLEVHDHGGRVAQGTVPLLVVDAWEHAYYLQYESDKARYLAALWSLWSWNDVAGRLERARGAATALRAA